MWLPPLLMLTLWSTAAGSKAPSNADNTTHVLFFLIDDLGYADVGYHGNPIGSAVYTPTIDALAKSGVRLEQYYVNFLCSPTRTSLLSGRYAYSIGMNAEVIVDGNPSCMPTSVSTIADRLHGGGWATSAYGKWDLGMTTWGCTPTCRGFDHFFGFYNAFNDYFTHMVGTGLDFRNDTHPVRTDDGAYFTEIVTVDAMRWIESVVDNRTNTFAYLAHESNHAPLEVPQKYIDGHCADTISADRPSRRIVCGMMRAVDDSLLNMTETYQRLGVWSRTIIIMSTDNGGNTDTGGSNFPLRGNKATSYEGGVRGVGWVGGGFATVNRAAISMEMIHVSDWYPTIVHGIAGLDVNVPADGTPALDGVDAWPSIVQGVKSSRNEMLLQLNPNNARYANGSAMLPMAAYRFNNYKLITGKPAVFGPGKSQSDWYSSDHCTSRDDHISPTTFPYKLTNATSPAFCPNGWVPPPESGNHPVPPINKYCAESPCYFPNTTFTSGEGLFLFDVVADPTETKNLASEQPNIVKEMLDKIYFYVNKSIIQDTGGKDPRSDPKNFNGVWTPWVGDPNPMNCAKPPPKPPPPCDGDGSTGDADSIAGIPSGKCSTSGWCSGPGFSGPPRVAHANIDSKVVASTVANITRKIAGFHGFTLSFDCSSLAVGNHTIDITCDCSYHPSAKSQVLQGGEVCTSNGKIVDCPN